ncbi:DUF2573 family protein [Brevibacillus sp. SYP-B805]|uniref:DUF2573 family protein n=1 Tax=Brevibacillus sp. SYP-B805 TaxID=1578199 RepID=UPI0013EBCC01|nr:DUF2573 family protein [Brevibacillus sp. SYP-B805]NGQ93860.1 DUF2573 family protein [Brevibacillus sp. SYP-B805]
MTEDQTPVIPELEGLVEKFTELLTGEATPERIEMVKIWCLYSHMQKVMPPLVQHWGSEPEHQEAKEKIRQIIDQLKRWNQEKNAK